MSYRFLVTVQAILNQPGPHLDLLKAAGCELVVNPRTRALTAPEMAELMGDIDAIIAGVDNINADVLAAGAPRLKVVSRYGVGFDTVDLVAAAQRNIVVTNTPGTNHTTVAELAIGFMLSLARRLPPMFASTLAGEWKQLMGVDLAGKTVGIIGLGRIGKAVATRLKAMEMEVLAHDVAPDTAFAAQHGITLVGMPELLRRSDFVTIHAAASPSAPPVLGEAEIRLMKPTAYLINVARGWLLDEVALYQALKEGRLAGAALDVYMKEPPGKHPLFELDNVLPTPHVGSATAECSDRTAMLAAQNALQVLRGERCPNCVNPDVYTLR